MILAVLAPVCAAQKHPSAAACQRSISQKRGKVFTWPVFAAFRTAVVESKSNFLARRPKMPSKCESRANAADELRAGVLAVPGGVIVDNVAEDPRIEQRENLV